MTAGPKLHPDGQSRRRRSRLRLAASCLTAGVLLGIAALICWSLDLISMQQAVALGLPAVPLLIVGVIAAAVPDPVTGRRLAFRTGLRVSVVLSRLRSATRRRGDRQ
jgi:hypothetical protein